MEASVIISQNIIIYIVQSWYKLIYNIFFWGFTILNYLVTMFLKQLPDDTNDESFLSLHFAENLR